MAESDNPRILVIDDDPANLKMIKLLLGACGYDTVTALSGEEGLKIFTDTAPEIVLTDVRMPGMDGIEVLRQIKQMDSIAEVIVVTGHGDMDLAIKALQNSASDFINKPVQIEALEIALLRAKEKIALKKQVRECTRFLEDEIARATNQLGRKCRQLELVCQVSKQIGEARSLDSIIEFVRDGLQSITGIRQCEILVLDGVGEELIAPYHKLIPRKFINSMLDSDQPRVLGHEEIELISGIVSGLQDGEKVMLLPIVNEESVPVAFAIVVLPPGGDASEELRLAQSIFSQVSGAIRRAVLHDEQLTWLRKMAEGRDRFGHLVGRHEKMLQVYRLIEDVAGTDAAVLIQGESGTGKELVARLIHETSHRKSGPIVSINCAAYPVTLIESELFGFEKGAFTGAAHAKRGCFELANGGTIFLDEIAEMPLPAQVKLLRVLQFKEFQKLGSESFTRVDVRILSASSKELRKEVEAERFREELFYRLNVITITLPPLRERITDLPLLVRSFMKKFSGTLDKEVSASLPADVMHILMHHDWPGNIRELENVLEHGAILCKGGEIRVSDLPGYLQKKGPQTGIRAECLEDIGKKHLLDVLERCRGNKIKAARILGISRSTLYRKLEQYGLSD